MATSSKPQARILIRDRAGADWKPVEAAAYTDEAELQELLAESPALIPIADIRDGATPFVVAVREFGLPGSGRTDAVFVNPDGHIGVIECKLADNAEIKRKVIGQVLEYGAHLWGMSYEDFDAQVQRHEGAPLADLTEATVEDEPWDEEEFRASVSECLEAGEFTLVIAVDGINDELERTVRFLNQQGGGTFTVAALELRRFQADGDTEVLVPHLFGPRAQPSRAGSSTTPWTKGSLFEEFEEALSDEMRDVVRDLYEWTEHNADELRLGSGRTRGSFTFRCSNADGQGMSLFSVITNGRLRLDLRHLAKHVPPHVFQEFCSTLASNPGFARLKDMQPSGAKLVRVSVTACLGTAQDVEQFKAAVLKVCRDA